MKTNKKGQLGMDVAKSFMLGLMVLLMIGVVLLIVMNSLSDTSLALDSFAVTNESGAYINATGYTLTYASEYGFVNPVITNVVNTTDNETILSGNYTVSSEGIVTNITTANYHTTLSISYTYQANNEIMSVTDNSSEGVVDFFSNTSTWLALLGVAVIILIISIVIVVVNRFGGSRRTI